MPEYSCRWGPIHTNLGNIVKAIGRRNRKASLLAHLESIAGYPPISDFAADVRAPGLLLSGSQDPFVSDAGAQKLAALCGATHERITAGHSIPAEVSQLYHSMFSFLL